MTMNEKMQRTVHEDFRVKREAAISDAEDRQRFLQERIAGLKELDAELASIGPKFMFAAMAGCMLNQLFGDKLRKFENKITNKITEIGSDINGQIAESLADTNVISNYVTHQSFLMNKATTQINGINNLIN